VTQLEKDLMNRTRERLQRLFKDTFDLYDMAGLKDFQAARGLSIAMLHETAFLLSASEASPADAARMLMKLMKETRREYSGEERRDDDHVFQSG